MAVKRIAHVSDDRLVTVCLDGASPSEQAHLDSCPECTARRDRLDEMLADVSEAATTDTDAVFTAERLATQQARILQRVALDGRPGRLIAFPAASMSDVRLFRTRPSSRWVAAAAAAGLAIGLLVGRLSLTGGPSRSSGVTDLRPAVSARLEPASPIISAAMHLSDDEFLGQIETAGSGPAEVLRPLHELTPLVEQIAAFER